MTLKREVISDKAEKAISNCKAEDFSFMDVNWLSREFDVSPSNLSRAFKYEKGETLQDFMIKVRIMRSLMLIIKRSDLTTREIAKRVDYSYSHFIQAFKKRMGITPGKFRSQCAAGWPEQPARLSPP